ncbi:ribonuclease J [Desulfovibrio subterraneus]|jgi:ribonuclease J|uniref:Ribonuclease J n=1 Tax=Desulfovibrio subterraneus TaxID=2718620 RepID=A0A7J0BIG2_9BACT|nr:ribonuclease J [Desulfovibrio subterraneus]GFM32935.1 ribonuclease J [Desulfovibrio subterraneus]
MPDHQDFLTLTPLGGYGEIGMNCTIWSTATTSVLVDCGLMFPDDYLLGIDVVIPQFDHILRQKEKVRGIVLTHGHEDHIGALPWLMPWLHVPIYGSRFTMALVEHKLREANLLDRSELVVVEPGQRLALGDMVFNFFPVCHSIIEGFGLGVETPVGRVVHTGDFKLDPNPIDGHSTDLDAFRRFSDEGVQLLLSDSTNIERDGHSLGEREIRDTFDGIFRDATGRVVVTLFSSHIQRIQEVFDIAAKYGRKVAVSGRSLLNNIDIARDLGFMRVPSGVYMDPQDMPALPDNEIVLLVTGSQGEPLSALSRITRGEHRSLAIKEGDTVIMSSRFIPGNARAITRLINDMYRLGAEVYYENFRNIHASGHAYREELRTMLETVRPRFFVPVHGEYRHLVKHCRLAHECGIPQEHTIILEDGDPLTLLPEGIRKEPRINLETVLVDGKGVGDVGSSVLKERQILGGEGMVVVFLVLDEQIWEILHGPDIVSKGFIFEAHYNHVLEDAKCIVLDILENMSPGDLEKLQDRIRSTLRRFFRKVLERDPVVLPVITMV